MEEWFWLKLWMCCSACPFIFYLPQRLRTDPLTPHQRGDDENKRSMNLRRQGSTCTCPVQQRIAKQWVHGDFFPHGWIMDQEQHTEGGEKRKYATLRVKHSDHRGDLEFGWSWGIVGNPNAPRHTLENSGVPSLWFRNKLREVPFVELKKLKL